MTTNRGSVQNPEEGPEFFLQKKRERKKQTFIELSYVNLHNHRMKWVDLFGSMRWKGADKGNAIEKKGWVGDTVEEAMAPHSSPFAWKIHGRRRLVGCSPRVCEESDTTERLHFHFLLSCIGEGRGNPLQCSCLENPRDGGAW